MCVTFGDCGVINSYGLTKGSSSNPRRLSINEIYYSRTCSLFRPTFVCLGIFRSSLIGRAKRRGVNKETWCICYFLRLYWVTFRARFMSDRILQSNEIQIGKSRHYTLEAQTCLCSFNTAIFKHLVLIVNSQDHEFTKQKPFPHQIRLISK